MEIVSVQSRVSWGYVGNAVAVPIVQAMGVPVWPIDTVSLAHHPGHGPTPRHTPSPDALFETLSTVLSKIDTTPFILMGYLGTAEQGDALLAALEKTARPYVLAVDPAFGDTAEGIYVDPAIVAFHERILGKADWLFPNAYELGVLTGLPVTNGDEIERAARRLMENGIEGLVISSAPGDDTIGNVLVTRTQVESVWVTRRDLKAKGTGDALSAALAACLAKGFDPAQALNLAVEVVDGLVRNATKRNDSELDIVAILPEIIEGESAQPGTVRSPTR